MKRLWAPWRSEYIKAGNQDGCIFCDKLKEEQDEKNFILERGNTCFTMLNIYPYNNGHIMVAPYSHQGDFAKLSEEEIKDIFLMVRKWVEIIKKAMNPAGFNIGLNLGKVSGAGVREHLHVHIVPRWDGDTNFMPVISETKVVSQSLKETYEILKKYG